MEPHAEIETFNGHTHAAMTEDTFCIHQVCKPRIHPHAIRLRAFHCCIGLCWVVVRLGCTIPLHETIEYGLEDARVG